MGKNPFNSRWQGAMLVISKIVYLVSGNCASTYETGGLYLQTRLNWAYNKGKWKKVTLLKLIIVLDLWYF